MTVNGLPVQRACRAVGLNRATYYRPLVDLGTAGCASHRGPHDPGGGQGSVGVLEML